MAAKETATQFSRVPVSRLSFLHFTLANVLELSSSRSQWFLKRWVSASPHTLSRAERSQANQSIKNIIVVLAWQTTQKNWIFQTTHYQDLSSLYYIHRYICISMHMLICTWAHTHIYVYIHYTYNVFIILIITYTIYIYLFIIYDEYMHACDVCACVCVLKGA